MELSHGQLSFLQGEELMPRAIVGVAASEFVVWRQRSCFASSHLPNFLLKHKDKGSQPISALLILA
jgi:hypothetical protein